MSLTWSREKGKSTVLGVGRDASWAWAVTVPAAQEISRRVDCSAIGKESRYVWFDRIALGDSNFVSPRINEILIGNTIYFVDPVGTVFDVSRNKVFSDNCLSF